MSTASTILAKKGATASILGVGTAIPKFQVDCRASAKFAAQTSCIDPEQVRTVKALYRRTGIDRRGSVLLSEALGTGATHEFYPPATSQTDRGPSMQQRNDRFGLEAPLMAYRASAAALDSSGMMPEEITHLITVTCTGFNAPGIDVALIERLGLSPTTERIQVGFMGCHAAINALRAARGIVAADPEAKVLLCCVELCSLHFQYGSDTDLIVSNALFADGAAAMVVAHGSPAVRTDQETETDSSITTTPIADQSIGAELGRLEASGSFLVPHSSDAMTWRIGDHGFLMTLSAQVPGLIEEHLNAFLSDWLGQRGETVESIGGWAAHPGGPKILSSVAQALQLDAEALRISRSVLSDHGNMSSATMVFILERFAQESIPKPWLMLGFGPGLEIEVALIR